MMVRSRRTRNSKNGTNGHHATGLRQARKNDRSTTPDPLGEAPIRRPGHSFPLSAVGACTKRSNVPHGEASDHAGIAKQNPIHEKAATGFLNRKFEHRLER